MTDEAVLAQIQEPRLQLFAARQKNDYPALVQTREAYPFTRTYSMTENNNNSWILEGTAKIGGQAGGSRVQGRISVYPTLAQAPGMGNAPLVYDYSAPKATVASQKAGAYPIPAGELPGKAVTVRDGGKSDSELASFTFPEAEARTMALADGAFDPTVKLEQGTDAMTLTIQSPGALRPTVSVPCAWDQVEVTHNGKAVESLANGHRVRFAAEDGGVYTITRSGAKEGSLLSFGAALQPETAVTMAAVYDGSGQLLLVEDTDQTTWLTLPRSLAARAAWVRLFQLSGSHCPVAAATELPFKAS